MSKGPICPACEMGDHGHESEPGVDLGVVRCACLCHGPRATKVVNGAKGECPYDHRTLEMTSDYRKVCPGCGAEVKKPGPRPVAFRSNSERSTNGDIIIEQPNGVCAACGQECCNCSTCVRQKGSRDLCNKCAQKRKVEDAKNENAGAAISPVS